MAAKIGCPGPAIGVVMAWAIDRLGRSLIDLLRTIKNLEAVGVDLYLDQQHLDTTLRPASYSSMTGAFPEFERSMIQQRVNAGLSSIKARIKFHHKGRHKVARLTGLGTGTVHKLKRKMAAREYQGVRSNMALKSALQGLRD